MTKVSMVFKFILESNGCNYASLLQGTGLNWEQIKSITQRLVQAGILYKTGLGPTAWFEVRPGADLARMKLSNEEKRTYKKQLLALLESGIKSVTDLMVSASLVAVFVIDLMDELVSSGKVIAIKNNCDFTRYKLTN